MGLEKPDGSDQRDRSLAEPGRRLPHRLHDVGATHDVPRANWSRPGVPAEGHDRPTATATSATSATATAASTATSTSAAPTAPAATSTSTATATSASATPATTAAASCRPVRGAEGDRPDASQGPHADPCEALLCRSHPPCSLEASGPCTCSEPEAGEEARSRHQGEPGARPQIDNGTSGPKGRQVVCGIRLFVLGAG